LFNSIIKSFFSHYSECSQYLQYVFKELVSEVINNNSIDEENEDDIENNVEEEEIIVNEKNMPIPTMDNDHENNLIPLPQLDINGDLPLFTDPNIENLVNDLDIDKNILQQNEENDRDNEYLIDTNQNEEDNQMNQDNYEELCRAHIEKYITDSEQYVQETELSKRVNQWSEKLKPLLTKQEKREKFNIKTYTERLLDSFSDKEVSFQDLIKVKEPYEVCRQFITLLHLSNSRNIELIVDKKNDQDTSDIITCKLVSSKVSEIDFEEVQKDLTCKTKI